MDEDTIVVTLADHVCCLEVDGTRSIDIRLPSPSDLKRYGAPDLQQLQQSQNGASRERAHQNWVSFQKGKSAAIGRQDFPVIMATGGILYVIDEQVFGEKYFLLVDEKGKLSIPKGYPWQVDEIYDPRKLAARRSLDTVALVIDGKLFSPPVGPREIASVDLFHCDDYMKETAGRLGLDKYICDQLDTAEYALNKDFVQITAEGHYAVAFHGNVTWDVEKSTLGFVRGIYVPFVRLNRLKTYDKQERNHVLVPVLGNENYCTVLQTGRRVHREEFTIDPLDRDLLHRLTPRERG